MIKYLLLFLLFCLLGFGYFSSNSKTSNLITDEQYEHNEKFVSIKNGSFNVEGNPFHLMAINFVTTLRMNDTMMWPSVYSGYVPQHDFHANNRDSCLNELKATLVLIHDMGFIRYV